MTYDDLLRCEAISEQEADIFFKALVKTKVIVKDVEFKGMQLYQMNGMDKMLLKDTDAESAMAKGLHLLLCNEILLNVNLLSPIFRVVDEPGIMRMMLASDWKNLSEADKKERFLLIPLQVLIERKKLQPN